MARQALQGVQKTAGADSLHVSNCLMALANALQVQGKSHEAQEYLCRLVKYYDDYDRSNPHRMIEHMERLASVLKL